MIFYIINRNRKGSSDVALFYFEHIVGSKTLFDLLYFFIPNYAIKSTNFCD